MQLCVVRKAYVYLCASQLLEMSQVNNEYFHLSLYIPLSYCCSMSLSYDGLWCNFDPEKQTVYWKYFISPQADNELKAQGLENSSGLVCRSVRYWSCCDWVIGCEQLSLQPPTCWAFQADSLQEMLNFHLLVVELIKKQTWMLVFVCFNIQLFIILKYWKSFKGEG